VGRSGGDMSYGWQASFRIGKLSERRSEVDAERRPRAPIDGKPVFESGS
jgi:hypothetical protein